MKEDHHWNRAENALRDLMANSYTLWSDSNVDYRTIGEWCNQRVYTQFRIQSAFLGAIENMRIRLPLQLSRWEIQEDDYVLSQFYTNLSVLIERMHSLQELQNDERVYVSTSSHFYRHLLSYIHDCAVQGSWNFPYLEEEQACSEEERLMCQQVLLNRLFLRLVKVQTEQWGIGVLSEIAEEYNIAQWDSQIKKVVSWKQPLQEFSEYLKEEYLRTEINIEELFPDRLFATKDRAIQIIQEYLSKLQFHSDIITLPWEDDIYQGI